MAELRPNDSMPPFQAEEFLGYSPQSDVLPKLDIADVIKLSLHLIAQSWLSIAVITLILVAGPNAVTTWLTGSVTLFGSIPAASGISDLVSGGITVLASGAELFAFGLVCYFVMSKHNPAWVKSTHLWKRLLPMAFLMLLSSFGIIVGLFLLIVPGAILAVVWVVATPVLIAENASPIQSLRRSISLTKGNRWPIFWLSLGMILAIYLGMSTGEFLASLIVDLTWFPSAGAILIGIFHAFSNAISPIVAVAIYQHLVFIKDGPETEEVASVFE